MEQRLLTMVGPFPPPRHGVSAVNEAVFSAAAEAGLKVERLDTAPISLSRALSVRLARAFKILGALRSVGFDALPGRGRTVYVSLSGGLGLVYEAIMVALARMRGLRVILHHHSFRYLDQPYWPMQLLAGIAGRHALHVVLGLRMGTALKERYRVIGEVLVLSNAAFVQPPRAPGLAPAPAGPKAVGLLANLSRSKGLEDFLALAEESAARGLQWRFILAGPFESKAEQLRYQPRVKSLANLEYRGALYGEAKSRFLKDIDVFVFPTRYHHEAEPLVVLEAMAHGRPVVAFGRGCIPEMLGGDGGVAIPVGADFVGPVLDLLEAWRSEGTAFHNRCQAAQRRFDELRTQGEPAMGRLLACIDPENP